MRGAKVDNQADHGTWLVIDAPYAGSAQFDKAGECCCGPHQKPAADGLQMDAVVADKPRETQAPGTRRFDEFEREPRFASTRGPADQHRARADEYCGSV